MNEPLYFRPSIGRWIVLSFLLFGSASGLSYGVGCFIVSVDSMSDNVVFSLILLAGSILIVLSSIFLSIMGAWYYGSRCRQVTINKEGVQRGIIKPEKIAWKDAEVGIAPLWVNFSKDGRLTRSEQCIYLLKGACNREELYSYGISQVWTWMCINKYFPRAKRLIASLERKSGNHTNDTYKTGNELILPEIIIWIPYNCELKEIISQKNNNY